MRRPACLALSLVLAWVVAAPARADQPLLADLSSHLVAITTGFTGTSVVLFGATDGAGDVIAVVRGPERDMVVRQKKPIAGIWINSRQVTFAAVPSYYAVFSSRPLDEIAPPSLQALHQIGIYDLHLDALGNDARRSPAELSLFRSALIAEQQRQGLYAASAGRIAFLGDRLFRATIDFPANVPTGTYLVEIFLIRNRSVVSGQTAPLVVSQTGIDAEVNEFAQKQTLLYGIVAVAGAAMAGWLASLPFRNA